MEDGPRGFHGEDAAPFQPAPFVFCFFFLTWRKRPRERKTRSVAVYPVSFCKARNLFGVTSNEQIKQAEISLGMRYLLPCVLWHATSDYKAFLYSARFICHLFPIWTL